MSPPEFHSANFGWGSDSSSDGLGRYAARGVGRGLRRGRGFSRGTTIRGRGNRGVPTTRGTTRSTALASTGTTAALSKTLKSITLTKISKLQKQRTAFGHRKEALLKEIGKAEYDQQERVERLVAAVKDENVPVSSDVDLSNILRWVDQSCVDTSVSHEKLLGFEEMLRGQLNMQTRRLDLADLYSRLLREWLSSSSVEFNELFVAEEDTSSEDSFEVIEKDR